MRLISNSAVLRTPGSASLAPSSTPAASAPSEAKRSPAGLRLVLVRVRRGDDRLGLGFAAARRAGVDRGAVGRGGRGAEEGGEEALLLRRDGAAAASSPAVRIGPPLLERLAVGDWPSVSGCRCRRLRRRSALPRRARRLRGLRQRLRRGLAVARRLRTGSRRHARPGLAVGT